MAQVFTSYSRKDRDFVRKLSDSLASRNREAWIDWKDIPLTAEWQREILTNIEGADSFVFVISPDSAGSSNCKSEIEHAVANNKRMVPIVCRPVPDSAVPEAIRKYQWIDFSAADTFEAKFIALMAALDTDLGWVQAHTRLLIRAKEWEREGKDKSFLLRGKDLREAERWIAASSDKDPKPTTLQSQHVLASRQMATRTQGVIVGAVLAAFAVAVGLTAYALVQASVARQNARDSRARELAAYAAQSLGTDPEQAILLGLQAMNATIRFGQPPPPAAEEILHRAILSSQVRLTLRGHTGVLIASAFSTDGARLLTASIDGTARIWDAQNGKVLRALRGPFVWASGAVAFSPDGMRLANVHDDTVEVWDCERDAQMLTLRGHSEKVYDVVYSPDGKRIVTASADNTVRVWDAVTGEESLTLHSEGVSAVTISADGARLATASRDGTRVWDADSGREVMNRQVRADTLALNPTGNFLAIGDHESTTVILLDARSGKEVREFHNSFPPSALAFRPGGDIDGDRLAIATSEGMIKIVDTHRGGDVMTLRRHLGVINTIAFSPDGKRLVSAGDDHTAKVWDVESHKELLTLRDGFVRDAALSQDGRVIATPAYPHAVALREVDTGKALSTLGPAADVTALAFSHEDHRLATASEDGTVGVWDVKSTREILSLRHVSEDGNVAFSADGMHLATLKDNTATVWDVEIGKEMFTLRAHAQAINAIVFSLDGDRLATASRDLTTRIWDVESGRELRSLSHAAPVYGVAFSPDAKRLATVGDERILKVWDVEAGKAVLTVPDFVSAVTFSPDGRLLATSGFDHAERLWDLESGKQVLTLSGGTGATLLTGTAKRIAFSRDGKRLLSVTDFGTAQVYILDREGLMALARIRVTRAFTAEECQRYFTSEPCPVAP